MGKLQNAFIKLRIKIEQWQRRRKLKYKDFTIISNNCWAGTAVYQPLGLPYNTPTVGLFFMDEDYIRFLENLEWYLDQPLKFISPVQSKYYDKVKDISFPIAVIGDDVEIFFMHYHSVEEAREKWERRKRRINPKRLLVKMSIRTKVYDVDGMLSQFSELPYSNKICFSPKGYKSNNEIIEVPELATLNIVGGDETESTLRHIDIYQLLNNLK